MDGMSNLFSEDRMPSRDDRGFYFHPDLDLFFDEDEGPLQRVKLMNSGFDHSWITLEADNDALFDAYGDGLEDLSDWNPLKAGWQRAGIWDTEDGPVALFVRRASDHAELAKAGVK